MSSRSSGRAGRPVAIALCLMLLTVGVAAFAAATARASDARLRQFVGKIGLPRADIPLDHALRPSAKVDFV
jgi:hypothetical protein